MDLSERFLQMDNYVRALQNSICAGIENLEVARFGEDLWKHEGTGGGISRVIENGAIFEKGAVNLSSISAKLDDAAAKQLSTHPQDFCVCGISLILHPGSPKIPTTHMNLRYFELETGAAWFGGGIDLTPYYPHPDDFRHFHKTLCSACDRIIPGSYERMKKECDKYFTLVHRKEMRGIGGVFFDYIDGGNASHLSLVRSIGDAFLDCYLPIVEKRRTESYTDADKRFQLIRRGRYVEFNLLYDRGTLFGLKSGGRVESILASLPYEVRFPYHEDPKPGSPQEEMLRYYQPMDWIKN